MTRVDTTRCDQCGNTAPSQNREGWLHIGLMGADHHRALVDAILDGRPHASVDLCSWGCARDYATLQVLDPSPEAP